MRWVALALVLVGCVAPDPELATSPLAFGPPVALPHDQWASEPRMHVGPEGTMYVAAPTFGTSRVAPEAAGWLWSSRDGGRTWEALLSPPPEEGTNQHRCACDSDVLALDDGTILYVEGYWTFAPGVGVVTMDWLVARSADGGSTWTHRARPTNDAPLVTTATPAAFAVDRPWLARVGDEVRLYYSWDEPDDPRWSQTLRYVTSRDGGASWGPARTMVAPVDRDQGFWPPLTTSDGELVLPIQRIADPGDPDASDVVMLRDGREHAAGIGVWTGNGGVSASFAADDAGRVFGTYVRKDEAHTLVLIRSDDGGVTWREPVEVATGGTLLRPWMDARGDGEIAIAWFATPASASAASEVAEDAAWHVQAARSRDGGATFQHAMVDTTPTRVGPPPSGGAATGDEWGDFLNVAFGADGRIRVAYARVEEPGAQQILVASSA